MYKVIEKSLTILFLLLYRNVIEITKTADEISAYTIVDDLFWLIDWGSLIDEK